MTELDSFSEILENPTDLTKGYESIRPKKEFSDSEMDAYIKSELNSNAAVDGFCLEELLADVFNCNEEQLSIEFQIDDQIREILTIFDENTWCDLDENQKLDTIKSLASMVGDRLGIKEMPSIRIRNDKDSYGAYNYESNEIVLSAEYISNPVDAVDTIMHELRHAYQHYRSEIMETKEDLMFKANQDYYVSPEKLSDGSWINFMDYYNQYVEVDARAFARIFTEALQ